MNDTKLHDNLTSTMSHADSLVIDLKAHRNAMSISLFSAEKTSKEFELNKFSLNKIQYATP